MPKETLSFCLMLFVIGCDSNSTAQPSEINHINHVGQSLGSGEEALPIVTDSPSAFGNISFRIGTDRWTSKHFEDRPELRDSAYFTFIPLKPHARGHETDTIANGLCDHLKVTSQHYSAKNFKF